MNFNSTGSFNFNQQIEEVPNRSVSYGGNKSKYRYGYRTYVALDESIQPDSQKSQNFNAPSQFIPTYKSNKYNADSGLRASASGYYRKAQIKAKQIIT